MPTPLPDNTVQTTTPRPATTIVKELREVANIFQKVADATTEDNPRFLALGTSLLLKEAADRLEFASTYHKTPANADVNERLFYDGARWHALGINLGVHPDRT